MRLIRLPGHPKAQAAAVRQVMESMNEISCVIQSNSSTAEESAAASEELSSQAQLLSYLAEQFKLRNCRSVSDMNMATGADDYLRLLCLLF